MSVAIRSTARRDARRIEELSTEYDFSLVGAFLVGKKDVVVQLPDALLPDSVTFLRILRDLSGESSPALRILADTTFNSCCVDETAAEHLPHVDGIVHVGPSCASQTARVPVFYLPSRCQKDFARRVIEEVKAVLDSSQAQQVAIAFSASVSAVMLELVTYWSAREGCGVIIGPEVSDHISHVDIGLRTVPTKATAYYLVTTEGHNDGSVRPLALLAAAQSATFHVALCADQPVRLEPFIKRTRQRFFLASKVEAAEAVGIVVCTLSIRGANEVARRLYEIVTRAGKRAYILFIGKMNVPKLSNFALDIDVFVMVGCPNHAVLLVDEAREYPKPILTPLELWSALAATAGCTEVPVDAGGIATTSVQYACRVLSRALSSTEGTVPSPHHTTTSTALCIARPLAVSTIARIQQRTYNGLEPKIGATPVQSAIISGRVGTAKGYEQIDGNRGSKK